jgi:hypothetical protein
MKPVVIGGALAVAILVGGCAGSSNSSEPTAPSPAVAPAPAPGGGEVTGSWSGRDDTNTVNVTWELTQSGASVTGVSAFNQQGEGGSGNVTGTVNGSTFSFRDAYSSVRMGTNTCALTVTGDLTIRGTTTAGPYDGTNSCSGALRGTLSFTKR